MMARSSRQEAPKSKANNEGHSKRPSDGRYSWANVTIRSCQREDAIFSKWDRVREDILRRIDLTHVSMIGCYRVGTKGSSRKARPTIFIFGNHHKHPKSVQPARNIINDVLKKHNVAEIEVEFLEGRQRRHSSDTESEEDGPKPKRDIEESGGAFRPDVVRLRSLPGQSLALKENISCSGTFGGFFEIILPGIAKPKVVGITCFHVINPTEKNKMDIVRDRIRQWRKKGIKPNDTGASDLTVDHPSPRVVQEKTRSLGKKLRKGDEMMYLEAKQRLSDCERLLHDIQMFNPGFGKVWAASGFRTGQAPSINSGNHTLPTNYDWALIEVPHERVGRNTTPGGHILKQSPLPKSLDNLTLCISGQRSGYSEGDYNALKETNIDHEMVDGKTVSMPTIEHSVIPRGDSTSFGRHGDSGALVYTKDTHVVVGLFFSGRVHPPFTSSFTHISDLIADIKSTTGAMEVRLF
ncbi:hypothetical protein PEX2_053920 [Penicillium expansum]|uniref:Uncharacterized protein n=1 Tax=Penicillium expansum TaxID=27334 RepID=A0A0A2JWL1_PENEN|nr:hypothetical protein PEX2_053920 [Penicillium expansum]KGO59814.1 hypothetical protein PEX2_053920 [Penicillium expansum]